MMIGALLAPRRFGHRLPEHDFTQKLTAKQLKAGRAGGRRSALVTGDAGTGVTQIRVREGRHVRTIAVLG